MDEFLIVFGIIVLLGTIVILLQIIIKNKKIRKFLEKIEDFLRHDARP